METHRREMTDILINTVIEAFYAESNDDATLYLESVLMQTGFNSDDIRMVMVKEVTQDQLVDALVQKLDAIASRENMTIDEVSSIVDANAIVSM